MSKPRPRAFTEVQHDLAYNIRAARRRRGLTQEGAAKLTRISAMTWGFLESGDRDCRLSSVARVAAGLGLDIRELFAPQAEGSQQRVTKYQPGALRSDDDDDDWSLAM
jgi:transcriptional regulator with XRE-family HTH domain